MTAVAVDSMASGSLGARHLKRLWSKAAVRRAGGRVEDDAPNEWQRDVITMDTLGLDLEGTYAYLFQEAPSFAAFEGWVLAESGPPDPFDLARLNAFVAGEPYPAAVQAQLQAITDSPPVLDTADLAFWDEHGYVVLHDAITEEECAATTRALFDFLGASPGDPESWYRGRSSIFVPLYHHPALRANRRAPRIRKACAQLWGTPDLFANTDRLSLNPPERPGWSFPGPALHWDVSLIPPVAFGMEGVLYLADTAANQGAFTCVPGLHRRIDEWLRGLPPGVDPRTQDLTPFGIERVAGRARDYVIWHQALAHGGSPNTADRPRLVQFIDLRPPTAPYAAVWR